ncbi:MULTISPECIES: adenosylcobinamide amidohydrolase [Dehalococcoides]|uniref:Adenosylcobinamide amidohydrolase n=2 Tax=root TaxID=1 RepID=A0AB38ZB02_9CHLR|nr:MULTISPECIES: adenosylcobinamide amidohydrolase [Dehalococcoides]AQU03033.1 cobalamin biosynthesis protein CbiZ [Dehalococcoides mccartyi]AQU04350.1 cobalamin biosynthesis protein CbiZ [Dehalococcoides mccartyi]MEA4879363.1 adenosylcobinamide amidohydrolase [Dehalococcoides mccartyi]OBW62074.1 MAG: cobalamin biosynthesis protein CbiZ [Dehalococcoides mccartyi]POZ58829.1 Adenosylcobinamide amidohydrolase [Dehalococcoides mccartyi]
MPAEQVNIRTVAEFHGIKAEVIEHEVWGVPANALVITFPEERQALSGRQGYRKVKAVCNIYLPDAIWPRLHNDKLSWNGYYRQVFSKALSAIGIPLSKVLVLSTGVTMDHLAFHEEKQGDLWVAVLATAGVESNALRIGQDKSSGIDRNGKFKPFGTINTIILTSESLPQSALASCFITATEAKTIALDELGVMSAYTPGLKASGTGTDQIVAVSGTGDKATYVGGHTLLGELMGRSVTLAIKEALTKRMASRKGH